MRATKAGLPLSRFGGGGRGEGAVLLAFLLLLTACDAPPPSPAPTAQVEDVVGNADVVLIRPVPLVLPRLTPIAATQHKTLRVAPLPPTASVAGPSDAAASTVSASVRMATAELKGLVEGRQEPIASRNLNVLGGSLPMTVTRTGPLTLSGAGPLLEVSTLLTATVGGPLKTCSTALGKKRCTTQNASVTHTATARAVLRPNLRPDWRFGIELMEHELISTKPPKLQVGPLSVDLPKEFAQELERAGEDLMKTVVVQALQKLEVKEAVTTYWARAQQPQKLGASGLSALLVPSQLAASEFWHDGTHLGFDFELTATLKVGRELVAGTLPLPNKTPLAAKRDGALYAQVPVCMSLADAQRQIEERLKAPLDADGQAFTVESVALSAGPAGKDREPQQLVLGVGFKLGDLAAPTAEGMMYFTGTPTVEDGLVTLPDLELDVQTGDFLVDLGMKWLVGAKVDEQLAKLVAWQPGALADLQTSLQNALDGLKSPQVAVVGAIEAVEPTEVTVDDASVCVVMGVEGRLNVEFTR